MTVHAHAQYVYTIKADSVKITNTCDSAELIIQNHTQGVRGGFLYNTGNGRTIFRKALQKINDSTYLVGADSLKVLAPEANVVYLTGSYANPPWLTALAWSKITGVPTDLGAFTNGPGYLTSSLAGVLYQPLENQRLSTSNTPSFHSLSLASGLSITGGSTANYLRGDGSIAAFPTNLSSFANGPGYLTNITGVSSFNARTGAVTLNSSDVTSVLGYTPYNGAANPSGFLTGISKSQVTGTGLAWQDVMNNGSTSTIAPSVNINGYGFKTSNPTAGTSNISGFSATNDASVAAGFGMASSTYTGPIILPSYGFMSSPGIAIQATGANSIRFGVNGILAGSFGNNGLLTLNDGITVAGLGTFGGGMNTAKITSTGNGTGTGASFTASSTAPSYTWENTSAGTDDKWWDVRTSGNALVFRTENDALSATDSYLQVNRTGITVSSIQLPSYTTNGFLQTTSSNGTLVSAALIASQVNTALGYTPYNAANPNGYITGISSSMVTTALGYTPPRPNGTTAQYITGNGTLATFPAVPNSSNYIVNGTSQQASANFNISGTGYVGTNLTVVHSLILPAIMTAGTTGDSVLMKNRQTGVVYGVPTSSLVTHSSGVGTGSVSIVAGTGAGVISIQPTIDGTIQGGIITITTGQSPALSEPIVRVNYSIAFPVASYVVISPANNNTAIYSTTNQVPHVVADPAGFSIVGSSSNVLPANLTYSWYYNVSGR